VFSILRCCIDHWYVTDLEDPRGASAEELEHLLSNQAVCAVNTYDKISLAYESAVEMAGETDLVLVFGSFPVVAEVLKLTSYNVLS
jgi:dihydrofolate synthase/folylpolyglutamate synthase